MRDMHPERNSHNIKPQFYESNFSAQLYQALRVAIAALGN